MYASHGEFAKKGPGIVTLDTVPSDDGYRNLVFGDIIVDGTGTRSLSGLSVAHAAFADGDGSARPQLGAIRISVQPVKVKTRHPAQDSSERPVQLQSGPVHEESRMAGLHQVQYVLLVE
jgi:hypothetical protein